MAKQLGVPFYFDGFVDYYVKRWAPGHDVWNTLKDVTATHPNTRYHVIYNALAQFSHIQAVSDPVSVHTHKEFEGYFMSLPGSDVRMEFNGPKQGLSYDGSNAFELTIVRGEPYQSNTIGYPLMLGRPAGAMSSTTNCVMKAIRDSVYYYDQQGEKRSRAWSEDGITRKPYEPKLANAMISHLRVRMDSLRQPTLPACERDSVSVSYIGLRSS
jgi:hypothetical protein